MDLDAILRCPRCKGSLSAHAAAYHCAACRLAYPVQDGIPNFLAVDARPLPDAQVTDEESSKP